MEIETLSLGRWTRDFFYAEFRNSFSITIVALSENEIAGFAVIWNIAGEIQLNNIAVHPDFRRHGIGTALISHLSGELDPYHPEKILIEVNENNQKARQFYKHLGFMETGIRPRYYDDDSAILMEKELA